MDVLCCSSSQKIFQEAVQQGDHTGLELLLGERHHKVNVNLYDREGQTALHKSCMKGNLALVKVLVRFGADVRQTSLDGWNALHIAAGCGHQEIALYLLKASHR